tara:strand:+ start:634 stop:876 length:243 start_codon:yes stop_codon:yes gene_type:complete
MKEETKNKIVEHLMKKHGDKELAKTIQKYFKLSLVHAEKDGVLEIVEKDGEEYVKLKVSQEELDLWFQKQQDQMKNSAVN